MLDCPMALGAAHVRIAEPHGGKSQRSGALIEGAVKEAPANGPTPQGIKVRLMDGRVGRVQAIVK